MEQGQLESVMRYHLQNFNDEAENLSSDTIHETVLSTSDGFGPANSKNIYKNVIRWTIRKAKAEDKKWPSDWMKLTVRELASKLIIFLLMLLPFAASSQLEVTIGAGKTELRDNAVTIAISYLKSFDSVFKNSDYLFTGKSSLFSMSPEINIQTGTQDAFSSINLKMTGLFMKFKTTTMAGLPTVNTSALFHTFPVSLGAETNNLFNNINGIVEAGWVPWYQSTGLKLPAVIKSTKLGIFLQAGYKFHVDSTGNKAIGGEIDESEELPERAIFRTKGSFGIDTKTLLKINGLKMGLVGNADVWYDFVNGAVYHKIEGRGRFFLDEVKYIDLIYQKGSGAPNFNQGDQFGVGLTITF